MSAGESLWVQLLKGGDVELSGCTVGKLETGCELEHCRREERDYDWGWVGWLSR